MSGYERLNIPYGDAAAVTPSDATDLLKVTRGLYVGGAGDLKVTMASGQVVTLPAVPVGTVLRLSVRHVWATGTTATNIVTLY